MVGGERAGQEIEKSLAPLSMSAKCQSLKRATAIMNHEEREKGKGWKQGLSFPIDKKMNPT